MELPNSLSDKTTGWQKAVAFGIMGAVGFGVFKLLALALPTILLAAQSLFWLVVIAVVFGLPTLYAVTNPMMVWGFFKTLSWNFTKFLIKMDPLSVMDRYLEFLKKKWKNLGKAIETVSGESIKLNREIDTTSKSYQENLRLGKAALEQGQKAAGSTYGVKAQADKSLLGVLTPLKARADNNLKMMQILSENWGSAIEQLGYQIKSKRTEYDIIKATFKGLKSAEDFLGSDNEQARLYGQSIIELENQVTAKLGYMEEFERKAKPILSNMSIEKQANMDAGLAELESYMSSNDLTFDKSLTQAEVVHITKYDPNDRNKVEEKVGKFNLNQKN